MVTTLKQMQYSQGISYIRSGKSSMWDLTCSSLFFHQFQAEPLCMQQAVPDSLICYQGFTVWAANFFASLLAATSDFSALVEG